MSREKKITGLKWLFELPSHHSHLARFGWGASRCSLIQLFRIRIWFGVYVWGRVHERVGGKISHLPKSVGESRGKLVFSGRYFLDFASLRPLRRNIYYVAAPSLGR